MTGFGCGEAVDGGTKFRVEIASVNRKQADIMVNLPRELAALEVKVRGVVAEKITRGRVNVRVTMDSGRGNKSSLKFDPELATSYRNALEGLAEEWAQPLKVVVTDLLRAPGVFSLEEGGVDIEGVWPVLEGILEEALAAHDEMRKAEGVELEKDIRARISEIGGHMEIVRDLAPGVGERYRETLQKRLAESGLEIPLDDERLIKEVALFADKSDILEELIRLDSHLRQFEKYLETDTPVGRELDFLSQELNREINTIGSKGNSAEIARHVVGAKAETERIREQVQNIE